VLIIHGPDATFNDHGISGDLPCAALKVACILGSQQDKTTRVIGHTGSVQVVGSIESF
jgi:hypothetical protein